MDLGGKEVDGLSDRERRRLYSCKRSGGSNPLMKKL